MDLSLVFRLVSLTHLLLVDPTVGSPPVPSDPLRDLHLVDCVVSLIHLLLIDPTVGSLLCWSFTGFCPRNLSGWLVGTYLRAHNCTIFLLDLQLVFAI